MEMSNSQSVPVSQQKTWESLNDPETLKACIAGCESVAKLSDTEYEMAVTVRVGPVSAKFKGKMSLADLNPPHSYSLVFEGQGGAAGFAKGNAKVSLSPDGTGTRINYTVAAQVGGKLAQVGSRLIDGAAKKMADDFFAAFVASLGGTPQTPTQPLSAWPSAGAAWSRKYKWAWIVLALAAVAMLYFLTK
jgi:carbon monoxide dehydrogenase subunit G